jgi:biopolymer transport protein ExbB
METTGVLAPIRQMIDIGGPVVALLLAISVATLAVALWKIWQFKSSGVGRHKALRASIALWDDRRSAEARRELDQSTSYLAPVIAMAYSANYGPGVSERLEAEAEARFMRLEHGFRFLDVVAQIAPLLGLFGTVLGMIQAFQALQEAGAQVDPSILAGGIWVALLTTAVGLAIAMPTSAFLSWLESRMEAERVVAARAIATVIHPMGQAGDRQAAHPAHAALSHVT